MNRSTGPGPKPSDFALGSAESRAAARMQLARLLDNRDWVTLYSESNSDRIDFGPWKNSLGLLLIFRHVLLPTVWATLPAVMVPACPECGQPFAEQGSFKTTVCFQPTCADQHDPAPPPKNRARRDTAYVITESEKKREWQALAMIHCFELEDGHIK